MLTWQLCLYGPHPVCAPATPGLRGRGASSPMTVNTDHTQAPRGRVYVESQQRRACHHHTEKRRTDDRAPLTPHTS